MRVEISVLEPGCVLATPVKANNPVALFFERGEGKLKAGSA